MGKAILTVLVASALAAATAEAGNPLGAGRERHLGGHGFLPSLYVGDPWVSTAFQNHTGGGVAIGLETPFRDIDGNEIFTLEGDLFYASLGLSYQQVLGATWALGASFEGLVRTGTNAQTLVADGANVDRALNVWGRKRLLRGERAQLTAGLVWEYRKVFVISPWEFARSIADGVPLEEAPLMDSIKAWTGSVTLDWAYALSPAFGVRVDANVGLYEDPDVRSVARATHRLGVMGEVDFAHLGGVPIGVTLGYSKGLPDDDPNAGLSGRLLGFWYTGREAFVVGVETGWMTLPTFGSQEDIDAMFGVFTLRYWF